MTAKATSSDPSMDFERLIAPHLDALVRTAERLTHSATDAEDLVQEAMLKGFRFFDSYERDTNFKAWIFKILMNTFLNHWRRRRKSMVSTDQEDAPEVEAPESEINTDDLGATFAHREAAVLSLVDDRIRQALMELPEPLRIVFMLSTLEDLKYREIADVLEVPVGTVMSRLFRSRAMLQERLEVYARESGFLKS